MDKKKSPIDQIIHNDNQGFLPVDEEKILIDDYPRKDIYEHEQDLKHPVRASLMPVLREGGLYSQKEFFKRHRKHLFTQNPFPGENFPEMPGKTIKAGKNSFY